MPTPIDISLAVTPHLPRWPGSPAIDFDPRLALGAGDPVTDTTLTFSVHTGTHIDAPSHFLPHGATVDAVPLERLIGPTVVAAIPDVSAIDARTLEDADIPADTTRLLLQTDNSKRWAAGGETELFDEGYVALTADAAAWVVERHIGLVGVDYLSVQRFHDPPDTHLILLRAEVVIVEGLNLAGVAAGRYDLVCLPLKLAGLEGAPARAILWPT